MALKKSKKRALECIHFVGLSLCGGKTSKSALAVIEYYPSQNKLFLSHLKANIKWDEVSSDEKIFQFIQNKFPNLESVAFDAPLALPKCMRCRLKCPGYETCTVKEVAWLRDNYNRLNVKKRPRRAYTPYTERCMEFYLSHHLEEKFHIQQALGANLAPLTARAMFLARRIKKRSLEVNVQVTLWRIGRYLGVQKSYLRKHKHSIEGVVIRKSILDKLQDKNVAFLYAQDIKIMVNNSQAFDAFLCALTGVLEYNGQCEKRPKGFPRSENWIAFPIRDLSSAFAL